MNTLRDVWRLIRTVSIVAGLLLTFFVLIELVRAFQTLSSVHPALGIIFLVFLLFILAAGACYFLIALRSFRPVLRDPLEGRPPETPKQLRSHARYISLLLARLADNEFLDKAARERMADESQLLSDKARTATLQSDLFSHMKSIEISLIEPAMLRLDEHASKEVRTCVRDVILGVTLSPWHSVDLLVVIYRNGSMLLKIMRVYKGRARLAEQGAILKDVLTIIATVNILNYSSKLLLNLGSFVPVLGRYADDIAQGVGAGLLTSIAGRAAMRRCRSYRDWSRKAEQEFIKDKLSDFFTDIKGIVVNDVLDTIRKPVEAQCPQDQVPVDLMSRMRQGVLKSIDDTFAAVDIFVYRPAVAVGTGVGTISSSIGRNTSTGLMGALRGTKKFAVLFGRKTAAAGIASGKQVEQAGSKIISGGKNLIKAAIGKFKR